MQLTIAHLLLASLAAVNYIPTVNALPFELAHGSNAGPARVAAVGNLRRRTENASVTDTTAAVEATTTATEEVATTTSVDTALETATDSVTDSLAETATDSALSVETIATDTAAETTSTDLPTPTLVYSGTTPIETSSFAQITDWPSCNNFLGSEGINLFENSFNNFNIEIQQVNVFEILIDDRGRARETRTFHSFPQPTNYYPEFDLSIQQNNIVAIDASGSNDNSFDGSNDHNNNDNNNFSGSNVFDKIKSFFK